MSRGILASLIAAFSAIALLMTAVAVSAQATGAVRMVEGSATDINSWAFQPASVTVQAGGSVTWTNAGAQPHTATSTAGAFDTGTVQPGQSRAVTFATAGTFEYICTPHPWMRGTVVVTAAAAKPAAAAPAPAAAAPAAQPKPAGAATTTAPNAGGFPMELAIPLLAGGAAALGGGTFMLRRPRRK